MANTNENDPEIKAIEAQNGQKDTVRTLSGRNPHGNMKQSTFLKEAKADMKKPQEPLLNLTYALLKTKDEKGNTVDLVINDKKTLKQMDERLRTVKALRKKKSLFTASFEGE